MRALSRYLVAMLAVVVLSFALPRLAPGDPLVFLAGIEEQQLTPEARMRLRQAFGLDQPLLAQFVRHLQGLVRGDWGTSILYRRPVRELVAERLGRTLLLAVPSFLLAMVAGVALGAWSAWWGSGRDALLVGVLGLASALPPFVFGMILLVCAVRYAPQLVVLVPGTEASLATRIVLPSVSMAATGAGGIFWITRAAAAEMARAPHVQVARGKGLPEFRLVVRHVLRPCLAPVVAACGVHAAVLVGGVAAVEALFAYPGLGRLTYEAALARDYPLLQATATVGMLFVLAIQAVAECTAHLVDPRGRQE